MYALFVRGVNSLGTLHRIHAKKMGSTRGPVREKPVLEMVTSLIGNMSEHSFHRARIARGLIKDGKHPTLHMQEEHSCV